ncbi:Aldo/keto reductase [Mycena olivaceomarginata]|nr:Aldo/keto reductase [Mycena olivaceomarginata]
MSPTVSQKTAVNVVLGTMSFGDPGSEGARVENVKDVEAALDSLLKHGHCEVRTLTRYLESFSAQRNCRSIRPVSTRGGTSETILGKVNWQEKGISVSTKILPLYSHLPDVTAAHSPEGLRKIIVESLKALNTDKLDIWYLHAPDRTIPYEVTLKAIDELYREGHFKRWGVSHYTSWEVAEIVGICKQHGYVQPSVYQGIYNAIHRNVESELFPALRKFGIAFYAFNPLAGGFLTDRYSTIDATPEAGDRLHPDGLAGKAFRARYWKPVFFDALAEVRTVATAHGLTMAEVAFRWIAHSSLLRRESGDAVIIGGSSLKQIEENLILAALNAAWSAVKADSTAYYKDF